MRPPRITTRLGPLLLCLALVAAGARGQQISVQGNGMTIANGDSTPSLGDHTHFGGVHLGAGVIDRTFTIHNSGAGVLSMGAPQRVGGESGDFTIIPPYPLLNLPGGASTTFTVRFIPSFLGQRRTTIRILNTSSNAPTFSFAISGEGTVPQPEITVLGNGQVISDGDPFPRVADGTDFGELDVSDSPRTHTFTIRNDGEAGLSLSGVEMFGGNSSDFSFATIPPAQLPIGTETTFSVAFSPTTTGLHTTTIRINNNDPDENPFTFTIQGTGTTLAPSLELRGKGVFVEPGDDTPSAADNTKFPSRRIHEGGVTNTFTVGNTGTSNLLITSIETIGGQAAEFTIPGPLPGPIAAGSSAGIEVRFDPVAYGLRTTTLRITSNDPVHPTYDVALLGAGGAFELLRVEQDGFDAVIHFNTNPDTTASTYIYSIRHGFTLDDMTTIESFQSPGGTTESYRHRGGFILDTGFWQILEVTLP